METMQFRDYFFRHNPAEIVISSSMKIVEDFCPGKGSLVRGLGKKARTITCKGSFVGATPALAMEQAAEFRRKTANEQAGMLFLPGMEPISARLRELVLEASGDGKVLPYAITFVEVA